MIQIEVEGYCQSCQDFCPDVTKATKYYTADGEITLGDTTVRCEHRKRCAGIKRYLEQQMKGEKE